MFVLIREASAAERLRSSRHVGSYPHQAHSFPDARYGSRVLEDLFNPPAAAQQFRLSVHDLDSENFPHLNAGIDVVGPKPPTPEDTGDRAWIDLWKYVRGIGIEGIQLCR